MLGVLVAALATPQPSPTPLKTITNVRSSPFCTALRENVGPAVKALIENNADFGNSKNLFLKMAHDKVSRSNSTLVIDLDVQQLGPFIDRIAKNLEDMQKKLSDERRFAPRPGTDDELRLAEIQKELRAIADRQNWALNVLSGTYFSYNGNRLRGRGDGIKDPVDSADSKQETPIVLPPIKAPADGGPQASASPAPSAAPAEMDLGLVGETKFAGLFNDLTTYQIAEQPLEEQAARTILASSAQCK